MLSENGRRRSDNSEREPDVFRTVMESKSEVYNGQAGEESKGLNERF